MFVGISSAEKVVISSGSSGWDCYSSGFIVVNWSIGEVVDDFEDVHSVLFVSLFK